MVETVEVMMTCPDDNETQVKVTVPLEEVKVKIDPTHTKELKINQEVGLVMKYPSMDMFVKNNFSDQPDVENVFELAIDCIDQIFEGEEVYEAKESYRGELMDFLETMNYAQFKQIQEFFETMPKMSYDVKFTNPKLRKSIPSHWRD